jgi:dolichol-phosphate mannosyltransferase
MSKPRPKVVVMIPTYNERENIGSLTREILALPIEHDFEVLVVDDNSPDGTALDVRDAFGGDPRVHLLLRTEKRGRGLAGIAGFRKALDLGADYVVEMDGDGSHQPLFIPSLLDVARRSDLVVGSRFVKGAKDADRPPHRRLITIFVRHFIRRLFSVPVRDVSSGFRCFRRKVLENVGLESLFSTGPSVVLEILYKAYRLGFSIEETPIVFIDRKSGKTKLTVLTLWRTLFSALRIRRAYGRLQPISRI